MLLRIFLQMLFLKNDATAVSAGETWMTPAGAAAYLARLW